MNRIKKQITTYQLPIFFLLTYLLSWWSTPFANGQIMPYGPALAALLVIAGTAGRPGLAARWRRTAQWRVAWYWYLIGPALILLYQGGAYVINLLLGATIEALPHLPPLAIVLELLLLGGWWEEPGWTGYALPKLLAHNNRRPAGALVAVFVLGVLRAIWHLPLYLAGHIPWFDVLVFEIAVQFIIAWLYNRSGGSVPVVIWFHFTSNLAGAVMYPVFVGVARMNYYALFVMLAVLVALALFKFSGPSPLQPKKPGRQADIEPQLSVPMSNIMRWHTTIGV